MKRAIEIAAGLFILASIPLLGLFLLYVGLAVLT